MLLDKLRNKQKQRREKGCIPAGRTLLSFDSYQELGTRKIKRIACCALEIRKGIRAFSESWQTAWAAWNTERLLPAWWQTAEPWHMRTWSRKRRATGS